MFQQRHDTGRLSAGNNLPAHHTGDIRIFREILEVAPVVDVAHEVDATAQVNVEAAPPRLFAQRHTHLAGECWIERASHEETRWKRSATIERAIRVATSVSRVSNTEARIRHGQIGNTEPRDTWGPTGQLRDIRGHPLVTLSRPEVDDHQILDETEALIVSHLGFC